MKKICLLLSFCLSINIFASGNMDAKKSGCQYIQDSAKVSWTAYKTEKKIPVTGFLKKVKINPSSGKTMRDIVIDSTFEVSGAKGSVDSKNVARDSKIARFFFGNFKGGAIIKGRVVNVSKTHIITRMNFNGTTQNIRLRYFFAGGYLKARANLDFVIQFGAKKSHTELGKACAAKHEGVTGTEAAIELTAKFTGC